MHRQIDCTIWSDPEFEKLSDDVKLVWFHLYTNQYTTGLGIYRMPVAGLAQDLGWDAQTYDKALQILEGGKIKSKAGSKGRKHTPGKRSPNVPGTFPERMGKPFANVCRATHTIYFPKYFAYNKPQNQNILTGLLKQLELIPNSPLKDHFIQTLNDFTKRWGKPFGKVSINSEGVLVQEQEQEQEQDKSSSVAGKNTAETRKQVTEVFQYWQKVTKHPRTTLTTDRFAKIRARLSEKFTVEYLKLAIDGCYASDFHQARSGSNNTKGVKYDSIDLIFRNGGKVDEFVNYLSAKPGGAPNPGDGVDRKYTDSTPDGGDDE